MKTEEKKVAGVDVGKRTLDVHALGSDRRFENTPEGIATLIGWLSEKNSTHVVCEPTGGYERDVVHEMTSAGLLVHLVHPNKARAFAVACGYCAKTDRMDARVLARYGEHFEISSTESDEAADAVRDILARRRQLVTDRAKEKNRLETARDEVADDIRAHIAFLDTRIAEIDETYQQRAAHCAQISNLSTLYQSVPGIGTLTAVTVAAYLPELSRCSSKEAVSLAGCAPWAKDSGSHRGYRRIQGGRGVPRHCLYMAALSAIRYNDTLRSFYQRLREKGKPGKVALAAVMRKLVVLLNAIARRKVPWATHYGESTA